MPFLKVPKMFRRSGGSSSGKSGKGQKMQERSHQNIGELPSSPANKKKAAKKISRTERMIAKRAAKAEKRAAKKGHGSLYGQGSPGSPQNGAKAPTYRGQSGSGASGSTRSNAGNQSPGSVSAGGGASVADRSMNPVLDQVVRKPSFSTSSGGLSSSQNDAASAAAGAGAGVASSRYGQQQQQQQIQPRQLQYNRPSSARSRGAGPVDLDDDDQYESTTTDEENTNISPEEFISAQAGAIVSVNGNGTSSYGYSSKYDQSITSNGNSNNSTSSLNHHQLQQFEQQQRISSGAGGGLYGQQHHNVTRLPNGQLVTYDSPDRTGARGSNPASPTYSSDFCLSTDNEDESYNQMRRNAPGMLPGAPPGSNLPPALNSPDNDSMMYTDDEGGTLFANLRGQLSEEEEAISPPMSPDDLLPPPPSGMKAPLPAGSAAAAAAAGRYQGPRDPDGDLSQMDPPSMEEEGDEPGRISVAPMSDLRSWSSSPDKSKVTTTTTGTGSSRSGLADGSSAGSVENHNPNPHGQAAAPRYTFADENEAAAMYRKGQKNELRPGSPSPGYKVNGGGSSSGGGNNGGAVMYPDSTDSEFETVPVPSGNLLPTIEDGSRSGMQAAAPPPGVPNAQEQRHHYQQQRAQAQDHEQQQQQQHQPPQTPDAFGDSFANFANFDSNFDPFSAGNGGEQAEQQGQGPSNGRLVSPDGFSSSAPTYIVEGGPTSKGGQRSSTAPSPLDDLVALQKERESLSRSGRRSRKDPSKSSSSINSAPVITSDYLRKTHKLGSATGDASSASGRRKSSSRHSESGARSTTSAGSSSAAMAAKDKLRQRRREKERARSRAAQVGSDDDASDGDRDESWLFDGVTGTLGPRGIAADLESLGGRSSRSKNSTGNRSHRSHRSHRSSKSRRRKNRSDASVGSRDSRYSHKSYRSSRSQMSHMSEQSRSVANDLLRLEMQLAMVGAQKGGDGDRSVGSRRSKTSRGESSSRRSAVSKKTKVTVVAPPGKLGIILANKTDSKGTVVSGVRTSSVLAEKISPGDRIIAIDGEDVSRMTVSEITTIMARKAEFERVLTVLTSAKAHRSDDLPSQIVGGGEMASVTGSSVTSFSQSYR